MRAKRLLVAIALGLLAAQLAPAQDFNLPKGPCGSKPPAKPQRRQGGEGLPPLPLPVTPLRRTERKRQPSPPPLIAKIEFGAPKAIVDPEGKKGVYHDWNKDPGDIPVLLTVANKALSIRYTWKRGALDVFPTDASQYPIYYYTGSDDFALTDAEVTRLREFVRAGGTIWGDTCFGDPDFFKGFVREMTKVMPDRHFRRLSNDHALFHCFYDIPTVEYIGPVPDVPDAIGEPVFYGMDVGSRTAIILGRYDMSCGWDGHIREGAHSVHPKDARKLGVNMIAYALATHRLGVYQSIAKVFYEASERARGDFVFAQVRLGENWDVQTNAIANLLKTVAAKTSTEVKFQLRYVDLAGDDLLEYPFLYLTGLYDFKLSEAQVHALKRYISSGGFLMVSPEAGSREFNEAFSREIARVLPGAAMVPLEGDHAVYSILYDIQGVGYADYVGQLGEDVPPLPLEGISLGGSTPVIYCPYGIGGGWRGFDHPFGRDVACGDAMKLGVNIVLYSMTH